MAESDRYDRMNSSQLEDEATQRGLNLDEFQSLANNKERAQRLRDHDAQRDADAQVAQQNAEAQRQAAEQQAQADTGQPQETGQANDAVQVDRDQQPQARTGSGQPEDATVPAPYSTPESLENAQAAASGEIRTDQSIDPADAEQVGGDPDYTDGNPEAR